MLDRREAETRRARFPPQNEMTWNETGARLAAALHVSSRFGAFLLPPARHGTAPVLQGAALPLCCRCASRSPWQRVEAAAVLLSLLIERLTEPNCHCFSAFPHIKRTACLSHPRPAPRISPPERGCRLCLRRLRSSCRSLHVVGFRLPTRSLRLASEDIHLPSTPTRMSCGPFHTRHHAPFTAFLRRRRSLTSTSRSASRCVRRQPLYSGAAPAASKNSLVQPCLDCSITSSPPTPGETP